MPVKAVMRRMPLAMLSSPMIFNRPVCAVFSRCVPPQSSLLNSPIETTRTMSGYFSPKSIIAPSFWASSLRHQRPLHRRRLPERGR